MKFRSTRSGETVTLDEALLQGLATDGGLYVPAELPRQDAADFADATTLTAVAERYLAPFFAGSTLADALPDIVAETFDFPIPLVDLSAEVGLPLSVLELFHGPTAAFKDIGAKFLAACLSRLDARHRHERPLTILVATSGDTGGAVAAAFHGRPGIEVVVLFPQGRVSPRQQHQLTCWGGNVRAFAVAGEFDDCQAMVKQAFVDPGLREQFRFSSANSINIGRLLPQSVYYANASLQHRRERGQTASWLIPTGNLGNGLAALLARAVGLPLDDIVLVSNANRTIPDYFRDGVFAPRASVATLASAMDVGNPSNLERLTALFGESRALSGAGLSAVAVDDNAIREQIVADAARLPFVWCPHSATAMYAWQQLSVAQRKASAWVVVATAHPAKFDTVVEPLVKRTVAVPETLAALLRRPASHQTIAPGLPALKAALA